MKPEAGNNHRRIVCKQEMLSTSNLSKRGKHTTGWKRVKHSGDCSIFLSLMSNKALLYVTFTFSTLLLTKEHNFMFKQNSCCKGGKKAKTKSNVSSETHLPQVHEHMASVSQHNSQPPPPSFLWGGRGRHMFAYSIGNLNLASIPSRGVSFYAHKKKW